MKVRIERRGGIAGVPVTTTVDTDDLPAETVAAVQHAIGRPPSPVRGADLFSYRLTVGEGAAASSAVLQEHEVTPELAPLLDRLGADGEFG